MKNRLSASTALRSVALLTMLALPAYAGAQETPVDAAKEAQTNAAAGVVTATPPTTTGSAAAAQAGSGISDTPVPADNSIIVTGSRIRSANIDSSAPIASVSGADFFKTGNINIGDVLNQLPQLHNTFNSSNSTRFIGTQGLNLLDLRGLGTNRTLVLINGRRQVTSALLSTGTEVDINTIPTDLIDRVDVVTSGESAIYGSDAIAGVVNFVLKQDYDGFQVRGQGGLSNYKDGGAYFVSALYGKNFADGRGNVAVNVEYAKQEPILASDRKHFARRDGLVQVDSDPAGAVNGSDGVPDYRFFTDLRSRVYSDGGLVEDFYNGNNYVFQPDGTLVPLGGTTVGLSRGSAVGGNGATFRNGDQIYLAPAQSRFTANLTGHFEVSPAFVPYIEGKFVRTHSTGTQSGPSFFARGGTLGDPYGREIIAPDNAFLSTQAANIIRGLYPDGTLDNGDGVNDFDQYGFLLNRNNVDFGSRIDDTRRDLYRIVGGVRGDLGNNFGYDVSVNYGHFKEKTYNRGNLDIQRFLLAADAVRDPTTGNIVCRSQIDPAARLAYPGGEPYLANDVASCVPLNLFGDGASSAAARAYVNPITSSVARASQLDIIASLNGDSSKWFELPGGPIGFAVGAEYRREKQYQAFDDLVQSGVTFLNAIPTFDPPTFEVKEAFGEIKIPILKDRPFFDRLTVNGAFRVSDYKGRTGTVWTYNGGATYAPVRDITFRGNYSRAVRSPALTETYGVISQNYATVVDPCALDHIGEGTNTRAANCAAAGIPTDFNYIYASSLEIRSGGNPNLRAETSDTITAGVVLQPRWVPGLTVSADYFDITVNKVISAPAAQDILDACYDAADLNNQFCALFQRAGAGGAATGEEPYRILEGSLQQTLLNYAKLKTRGVDIQAAYNHKFGPVGFSAQINATYNIENNQFLFPTDPTRPDQLVYELSYPKWQGNLDSQFKIGTVTFGYQARYIGKMTPGEIENIKSVGGRPPQNEDYTTFRFYKAVWYHDMRVSMDVGEKFNIYAGVDNIVNKLPPYGLTGVGGGSGIYDNRGRYMYMGAVAKF